MSDLLFSLNTIAPIFLLVGIGWLAKRIGLVDEHFVGSASRLNFRTGLPALLFINIYQQADSDFYDWKFVGFVVGASLLIALALFLIVPRFVGDKSKASAIIHTVFKPNLIVLGLPLAVMLFGSEHTSSICMLLPVLVPFNNVAAVLILYALDPRGKNGQSHPILSPFASIVKNPIVIAAVLAILIKQLSISLPPFLVTVISYLSAMATPFALITLGAQMTMKSVLKDRRYVVTATLCKVLLTPLLLVPLGYCFGFRGYELATLFIVSASPSAVNCYMLAREMHSDEVLTGEIVLSTTLASLFVLFAGIFVLKSFAAI